MPVGTLYRYRSLAGDGFRNTQDIFLRKRLYWPLHSELNDPAEGSYRDAVGLEKGSDGRWYAPKVPLKRPIAEARVLSFTEDPRHPLMWAHYANAHRGLCLGFLRSALTGVQPVRYPARVPRVSADTPEEELAAKTFLTKRKAWAYEREWRLVSAATASEQQSFVGLSAKALARVILGERMPPEDREWVFEWLRLSGCHASTWRVTFSGAEAKLHLVRVSPSDRW